MVFFGVLRKLIIIAAYIAGLAIVMMMLITTADVLLRIFGIGITGAYDLVRACGVIAIACALPYVTAVKGHIAIEYFYHQFSRTGRIVLDTFFRISSLSVFGILTVKTFEYGLSLFQTGEILPNIGMPVFWIPIVISFNCLLMMVVFVFHLLHPGKEYIKP